MIGPAPGLGHSFWASAPLSSRALRGASGSEFVPLVQLRPAVPPSPDICVRKLIKSESPRVELSRASGHLEVKGRQ